MGKLQQVNEKLTAAGHGAWKAGYYAGRAVSWTAAAVPGAAFLAAGANAISRVFKQVDVMPDVLLSMHETVDPKMAHENLLVQGIGLVAQAGVVTTEVGNDVAGYGGDIGGVIGDQFDAHDTGETIGRIAGDSAVMGATGLAAYKLAGKQLVPTPPQ